MAVSPSEFGHKLNRVATAVKTRNRKALDARAKVTKEAIVAAGRARTRKADARWVRYTFETDDVVKMRLAGGYAVLFQRGSYKKPEGWDEGPKKVTSRRIRSAAKKGISLRQAKVLAFPDGSFATSVHHPPVAAKSYFREGVAASRTAGHAAYKKVIVHSITEALR